CFTRVSDGWEQSIADIDVDHAPLVIVEDLPDAGAVTRRCGKLQRSLDISEGPLLRVALFRTGSSHEERSGRLFIVVHHLAVDGVSWRILLEDLMTTYENLRQGAPAVL